MQFNLEFFLKIDNFLDKFKFHELPRAQDAVCIRFDHLGPKKSPSAKTTPATYALDPSAKERDKMEFEPIMNNEELKKEVRNNHGS